MHASGSFLHIGKKVYAECPTPVHIVHSVERRGMRLPCKRRRCPACGPAIWKPYQQAKYMSGVDGVPAHELKVFTLTAPGAEELPDSAAIVRWNLDAPLRLNRFITLLRRAFPQANLEFWGVWEYQNRGALHRHGLIRGIRFIPIELFRKLAIQAGFGPRVQLEAVKVSRGGVKALLGYFTGYLLKGVADWDRRAMVISASQGWALYWKRRNRREGPSEWVWCSEGTWWAFVGREEFIRELGGDSEIPVLVDTPIPDWVLREDCDVQGEGAA